MINWKKQAKKYKDDYLNDLKTLISIDSERDDNNSSKDFPLGKGPADALKKYLSFGERDGFKTKNLDNLVGYIEYGEGDKTFAILAHADVMPAGEGWDTNPFEMVVKDGNAYGRGVSDDKGPGLAAYYGLKIMKDNNIKPNCKIRFIVGTDEESNWTGMKHYFDLEPEPDFGFSPDAEFPVINGEKGNTTFENTFNNNQSQNASCVLKNFDSGLRENMVPRDAYADILVNDKDEINSQFTTFMEDNDLKGNSEITENGIKLHLIGKSAHGMEPKNGVNSGTYLATFLSEFSFTEDADNFLTFISKYLHNDSRANHLATNYHDKIMGDLTMNVGIMKFSQTDGGFINTNFRYPKGISVENIEEHLNNAISKFSGVVKNTDNMVPHYVDPADPIVNRLISIYRDQTGVKKAEPEVVGGGTYGRMMKRGVAFGALFPWTEDTMHQANEFQPIDDLILAMSIYSQSITDLSTDK
ncbi:dipeptidase PepV [Apilactobacillus apisilvae]|uniref:Dipeptidase PepV n=1 Tax=Apilactobacillus apisilvae TaxID=2923364 RepID=A0ABY4PHI0_9LACO|nr:dipeptidase PepV [Apilactobacillus apisilvae]UQS85229.1 dipeptidase PepV [Apilactobacillus apisilvae]